MENSSRELIANRLKTLRKQSDMSQKEVAQKLSVDSSTISYYENGKRSVPTDILKDFARIYNTTLEDIAGDVKYTQRHEYMAIVKEPVPPFIRNIRVNLLLIAAFLVFFIALFMRSIGWVSAAMVLFIMHGFAVAYKVFIVHGREVKYYTYSEEKKPLYVYKKANTKRNQSLISIIYLSLTGLLGVFIVSGFMSITVQLETNPLEGYIMLTLFAVNSGFLIYIIIQAIRKKLVENTFTELDKNKRMDTIKYMVFKGFILASYVWSMTVFHFADTFTQSISSSRVILIVFTHIIHIGLYVIPVGIIWMHMNYELQRKTT